MPKTWTNPVAWLRNLYEAGTITRRIEDAEEVYHEIEKHRREMKRLRGVLRYATKRAEETALAYGWSAEQVAAAKRGESLEWTAEQIARFEAEREEERAS